MLRCAGKSILEIEIRESELKFVQDSVALVIIFSRLDSRPEGNRVAKAGGVRIRQGAVLLYDLQEGVLFRVPRKLELDRGSNPGTDRPDRGGSKLPEPVISKPGVCI